MPGNKRSIEKAIEKEELQGGLPDALGNYGLFKIICKSMAGQASRALPAQHAGAEEIAAEAATARSARSKIKRLYI